MCFIVLGKYNVTSVARRLNRVKLKILKHEDREGLEVNLTQTRPRVTGPIINIKC